jgi:tetratricopeptide (TPR) repeat protein
MFASITMRSCVRAGGLSLLLLVGGCQSAVPGYRHEGQGPDERLLDLVEAYKVRQALGGGDSDGTRLVDAQRLTNELRRLHLEYPVHAATLFMLATVTFEEGRPDRAAAYLDDLSGIQPDHPEGGLLRSRIAIDEGNLPGARRVLEQAIRYRPDHAGLREALGSVAFHENDMEAARFNLELARRLGAPAWRVAYNLGLIEESAGNDLVAIELYEVAIELQPGFSPASSRLIGLRAEAGDVVR